MTITERQIVSMSTEEERVGSYDLSDELEVGETIGSVDSVTEVTTTPILSSVSGGAVKSSTWVNKRGDDVAANVGVQCDIVADTTEGQAVLLWVLTTSEGQVIRRETMVRVM